MPKPKVRLSYDGWLALPAAAREKLGLATGYQLELELVGETIVPHPAGTAGAAGPVPVEPAAAPPEPSPPAVPAAAAKHGPGRPRKVPAAIVLPPNLKARGARRRAAAR